MPTHYLSKTDAALKLLAADIIQLKVFTDRHIHREDMHLLSEIFSILKLIDVTKLGLELTDIGLIYAYYSESIGLKEDVYPRFSTLQYLDKIDANKLYYYLLSYEKNYPEKCCQTLISRKL